MSTGWRCPVCGRVWAPFVHECPGPHTAFDVRTSPSTHPRDTGISTSPRHPRNYPAFFHDGRERCTYCGLDPASEACQKGHR